MSSTTGPSWGNENLCVIEVNPDRVLSKGSLNYSGSYPLLSAGTNCDVSIIGVNKLFKKGVSLERRIFWIICLFICCSLVAYYVSSRFHYIMSLPTQMVVILQLNESLLLPDVTLCPIPMFKWNKLKNMGMTPTGFIGLDFPKGNGFDSRELWRMLAPSEFLVVSLVNMKSSRKDWRVHYTTLGVCYTHHHDQLIEASGLNFGMQLKLNWDELIETNSSFGDTSGLKVYFHAHNDEVLTEIEGIFLTAYEDISIAIRVKEFKSLNRSDHPCIVDPGYSRSKCLNGCFNQALYDTIPCRLPFMSGDAPNSTDTTNSCRKPEEYNDAFGTFWNEARTNVSLWMNCSRRCLIECNKVVYTPYVESVATSKRNIGNFIIYYPTMSYEIVREKEAYDLIALLCDVGGTFGLFLGFSLLTVVEISEFVVLACHNRFQIFRRNWQVRKQVENAIP